MHFYVTIFQEYKRNFQFLKLRVKTTLLSRRIYPEDDGCILCGNITL
jgi:hypothetical protein